ncbi:MAG: NAD(P)H-hydrate dehydratase [Bacillota bacterium]|nr:NAD(P)H-hydrate dehydratase [Bacillota bacterium]
MYKELVTAKQMRYADNFAIENLGIDELILIENAAIAVLGECPDSNEAAIFCGSGNNGSDGFALARHLYNRGTKVKVITVFDTENTNLNILKKLGAQVISFDEMKDIDADLYIDAIFGTGLSREVTGKAAEAINFINKKEAFKIAIDLPSGINADTGEVMGCALKADVTVTLARGKVGLYQYPGREYAGKVIVKDISIPTMCFEKTNIFATEGIKMPERREDTNKGSYGKVLTICGSLGMAGAAYMAAQAAVKSGAGLVSCAVPSCIFSYTGKRLIEAMTINLPDDGKVITIDALDKIIEESKKANAILIGCGMRNTKQSAYLIREAVKTLKNKKLVIDADGINALKEDLNLLEGTTITPHPGEMARLLKSDIASVQKDRLSCACNFAKKYGCTVILKGAGTVTAYPDGRAFINLTGNPGMSNGGSGDVLAGLTASFLAQGIPEGEVAAVYVHGLAGDMCKKKYSDNAMSATDIIKMLPAAVKKCKV